MPRIFSHRTDRVIYISYDLYRMWRNPFILLERIIRRIYLL